MIRHTSFDKVTISSKHKMANSGYSSVGHLILNKSCSESVDILRRFCKKVCLGLTKEFVQVDQVSQRFALFFDTVKPTVDSFAKFAMCFLKNPSVDNYFMELQIERLVWTEISNKVHSGQVFHNESTDFDAFRCFAIFNRFCDPSTMTLDQRNANRFLKKLFAEQVTRELDLQSFLKQVLQNFAAVQPQIKRIFDEFVRDVYIEESQLKIRQKTEVNFSLKSVTVTTNHIFIFDQNSCSDEEIFFQQISLKPSGTSQEQQISALVLASKSDMNVQKPQQILFSKKKTTIITVKTPDKGSLELSFNADLDHYKIYQWTRGIEMALEGKRAKMTQLKSLLQSANVSKHPNKLGRVQTCMALLPAKNASK